MKIILLILIVFLFGTATEIIPVYGQSSSTTQSPPLSTTQLPPSINKTYHLHNFFKTNWYRDNHYCILNNMHLATIFTEDEHKQLQKQISEAGYSDYYWIGLTGLGNSHYYWYGHNKPMAYENWYNLEPYQKHDCISVHQPNIKWEFDQCASYNYFVYESDNSN